MGGLGCGREDLVIFYEVISVASVLSCTNQSLVPCFIHIYCFRLGIDGKWAKTTSWKVNRLLYIKQLSGSCQT
jgi:hypothetical protein